jgi:hypothetical protein
MGNKDKCGASPQKKEKRKPMGESATGVRNVLTLQKYLEGQD